MDPRDKLNAILEQKRRLQARIEEIKSTDTDNLIKDPQLDRLLQKKRAMQEERVKQEEYRKLEKEYNERKKQMEREKQLQRIKNEKRVLELEVAMKKVVVQGIKQKVRGMNSEQLMRPNYFTSVAPDGKASHSNFKDAFEGYLLNQGPEKLVPKYDIKKLNEERLEIFERKEEIVMRQLLLKELAASPEPIDLDVMALSREELEDELAAREIDFEEFIHVVSKQEIVDNYSKIEKSIKERIVDKKQEIEDEKAQSFVLQRERKALREHVSELPYKDVEIIKRLLYDLFDQICVQYEKRHVALSNQDKQQRVKNLQKQYDQILNNDLVEELSHQIIEQMLQNMRKEMLKEASEEVSKLHDFAHQKTEECFKSALGEGSIYPKILDLDHYKVPLLFVNEEENEIGRPKNEKYMKNVKNEYNVYETQESTTNLVNDIALLDLQQRYMGKIPTQLKNQTQFKTEDTFFFYDRELFAISRISIKSVKNNKTYHTFNSQVDIILGVHKIHRNWLVYTQTQILLVTPWGREELGSQLGGRISNPCGIICFCTFYPVCSLLAHPTSALLGFEKGQILKFNFNKNRLTQVQTNITHYLPVIEHAKSGDDPAFPLDNRNYLAIQQEKPKPLDQLHQYRQFFEHHSQPIIFLGFYRIDKMISIDKTLKCALWEYSRSRGVSTYQPVFKFEIKSSYSVYNEDENPRYKDIYPLTTSTETPEDMYQKYMLTESFLKLQLYNNPKKEIAYFKAPHWEKEDEDKPIWKVTYKENKSQVNKILQSYYNVVDGKISAQQAQLQGDNIFILCEREHIIRNDLKTIKLYSWHIFDRRLGKVGLEIDMFKDQKVSNFVLLPKQFRGTDLELALIANSGRLLLFSLLTGQLLKNINEEINSLEADSQIYFRSLVKTQDAGSIYGISNSGIAQLSWEDNNSINDRGKLNKAIDTAKRKYFR